MTFIPQAHPCNALNKYSGKLYDENSQRPYWNIYAKQYEHEHQREEIIRHCKHFNCVQWDCTEVTFEATREGYIVAFLDHRRYKYTFHFRNGGLQTFYTNNII